MHKIGEVASSDTAVVHSWEIKTITNEQCLHLTVYSTPAVSEGFTCESFIHSFIQCPITIKRITAS